MLICVPLITFIEFNDWEIKNETDETYYYNVDLIKLLFKQDYLYKSLTRSKIAYFSIDDYRLGKSRFLFSRLK